MLYLLLLALAVSLDSLFVGFTYGLRGIRMSSTAHVVIAVTSGLLMWIPMLAATALADLAPGFAAVAGAALLVGLGGWHILAAWSRSGRRGIDAHGPTPTRLLLRLRLASLGVVVEILHDPVSADADHSGVIEMSEAWALGIALGLDALGAGAAAALAGISYWIVPLTALACCLLVAGGQQLAAVASRWAPDGIGWPYTIVPGLILVGLGTARLVLS